MPNKELDQLCKIADKSDKKGFDYPSRTRAARVAIFLAVNHEWRREEIINVFNQIGDEDE
jgi:hypothetical protein